MEQIDKGKTVAGSLLIGVALLSGNTTLLAAAGSMGVKFVSDEVPKLRQHIRPPSLEAGSALTKAYERALRRTIRDMQKEYRKRVDGRSDLKAFKLIETSAGAVGQRGYQPLVGNLEDAEQHLAGALDNLLHGHDDKQVNWIKQGLLERTALAFQRELIADHDALQLFHGWLIQQIMQNIAHLNLKLDELPTLISQLSNQNHLIDALDKSSERLEARLNQMQQDIRDMQQDVRDIRQDVRQLTEQPDAKPTPKSSVFDNSGMQVYGGLEQIAGNQYKQSAHASGGNTATVNNYN